MGGKGGGKGGGDEHNTPPLYKINFYDQDIHEWTNILDAKYIYHDGDVTGLSYDYPDIVNVELAIKKLYELTKTRYLYELNPSYPSDVWNINHNLGSKPVHVTVTDSNWDMVVPVSIHYTDYDNVEIHLPNSIGGRALVSI